MGVVAQSVQQPKRGVVSAIIDLPQRNVSQFMGQNSRQFMIAEFLQQGSLDQQMGMVRDRHRGRVPTFRIPHLVQRYEHVESQLFGNAVNERVHALVLISVDPNGGAEQFQANGLHIHSRKAIRMHPPPSVGQVGLQIGSQLVQIGRNKPIECQSFVRQFRFRSHPAMLTKHRVRKHAGTERE